MKVTVLGFSNDNREAVILEDVGCGAVESCCLTQSDVFTIWLHLHKTPVASLRVKQQN